MGFLGWELVNIRREEGYLVTYWKRETFDCEIGDELNQNREQLKYPGYMKW